jgi:F1F0 ATPase subunit 2
MTGTVAIAARVMLWLAAGLALGTAFFALLRLTVACYASGRHWPWAVGLHVARWVFLVALLVPISRAGALPLLTTSLGVFLARSIVIRRSRALS